MTDQQPTQPIIPHSGKARQPYWVQLLVGFSLFGALLLVAGFLGVIILLAQVGDSDNSPDNAPFVLFGLLLVLAIVVLSDIFHRMGKSGIVVGLVIPFGLFTIQAGRSGNFLIDEQSGWLVGLTAVVLAVLYGIGVHLRNSKVEPEPNNNGGREAPMETEREV